MKVTRGAFLDFVELDDKTVWPRLREPDASNNIEWVLRCGNAAQLEAVRMSAASIVHACRALVMATETKRRKVIRGLKEIT
jgi:hypothetical protein